MSYRDYERDYDDGDRSEFASPGGRSALRAAKRGNPPQPSVPDVQAEEHADPGGQGPWLLL